MENLFSFQISTNVLLIMEVVITFVSTNQDHLNVNVKTDIFSRPMEKLALVTKYLILPDLLFSEIRAMNLQATFEPQTYCSGALRGTEGLVRSAEGDLHLASKSLFVSENNTLIPFLTR